MTLDVSGATEDGAALLDAVDEFVAEYVIYPSEHTRHSHVLWCAHTYLMDCFDSTPRLYFKSPEPGSGKTRALEVTEHLVAHGVLAIDVTPAYLIRRVSSSPMPTLLYDEIDTVFGPKAKEHEDIRAVINSGHRQGASAGRCMVMGNKVALVDLPSYCPVALAGLGDLPDTITDRAVVVSMRKRRDGEKVKPWRSRVDAPKAAKLGERLELWADSVRDTARDYWPEMPEGVQDRNADRWEALIEVADLAGGRWPELARAAAVADVADKPGEKESQGVLLLTDIQGIFEDNQHLAANGKSAMKTPTLVGKLIAMEESPWIDVRRGGLPMDARGLADRLRPYGIKSHDIRWRGETDGANGTVSKGYFRSDFEDAWARYVTRNGSDATKSAAKHGEAATNGSRSTSHVAAVADVAASRRERPSRS